MSLEQKTKKIIMDILVMSLEGQAGKEDLEMLKSILDGSEVARDYYCRAVSVAEYIRKKDWKADGIQESGCDKILSTDLWHALAGQEEDAESIIVETPCVINSKEAECGLGKRNKLIFNSAILVTAACLLFAFVLYFTADDFQKDAATLADCYNAKWADGGIQKGDRILFRSGVHSLEEGYASLVFDNNVRVAFESPCSFEILSEDRIRLDYGVLYSRVPSESIGFSVVTPKCLVVDLGTEFGVKVEYDGTTELHVNHGKTMLLAGNKTSIEVSEGYARKIYDPGSVTEIPCESDYFVREINSETGMIWRGDTHFSLADVVGGGNGWGTGNQESGIEPTTGERINYLSYNREGEGKYVSVSPDKYSYIDGVFVPCGPTQIVSSHGHIFSDCPITNNIYYTDIISGAGSGINDYNDRAGKYLLGGKRYGVKGNPSIFMHANLGITYDLDAIRADMPMNDIVSFVSSAGLSSDLPRIGNATVWVLIDGNARFKMQVDQPGAAVSIEVDIHDTDRFLSLVTTDGEDPDMYGDSNLRATDSDWCVFSSPELIFSVK